jgi:uncharacterized protein (TIGR03067 family)
MVRVRLLCVGLAVVLFGLPCNVAYPQSAAVKEEMKALAGRWAVPCAEMGDGAHGFTFFADGKFKWENYSFAAGGWKLTDSGKFTVDPTKNPRTMDMSGLLWIYEIRGNQLRLGFNGDDLKKRPADFSAKGIIIYTLDRSK